jgi:LacI family transcriptional regulator
MEPQASISVVSINNYLGGRMAVSHLLEQGYRHIGHISGPLDWWEARQRMSGWKDVLIEAGIPPKEDQWVEGNWTSESGAKAISKLLSQYPQMDAVFVANDQMSLSVFQAACEKNLKVPDRLGIVGFDNIAESAFFWPPLTTIDQDLLSLGKMALEEIIQIIEAGWQEREAIGPKSIMLAPSLIVRQSSIRKSGQRR